MPSQEKACPVKVAVRARPLLPTELGDGLQSTIEILPNKTQIIIGSEKGFTFDYVFDESTKQDEVYSSCIKDSVSSFVQGYNVSVLAYGQTGSGKTHTMGTDYLGGCPQQEDCHGIIPRVLREVFEIVGDKSEYVVRVSFIEILNESVYDLLNTTKTRETLTIREIGQCVMLQGLQQQIVKNKEEALKCLEQGCTKRTTGATAMNACSSRSHAIFTLHLEHITDEFVKTSKLYLVDLAGSEDIKRTQCTGDRRKEGVSINRGLLALGNVINQLSSDFGKSSFISYRDSLLTRILKDALNVKNFTVMIACISPALCNIIETVNTLRYADRVRQIKTKPRIHRINKENIFHRSLNIPPTPAAWRQLGSNSIPFKTPLDMKTFQKHSSILSQPRFESTALEEEPDSIFPSPPKKKRTRSSSRISTSTVIDDHPPSPSLQVKSYTPIVQRVCRQLEETMCKKMVETIQKTFDSRLRHTTLPISPVHNDETAEECFTPFQESVIQTVSTAIQKEKSLFELNNSLKDKANIEETASPKLKTPTIKLPKIVTELPQTAIAHRTRRRTVFFMPQSKPSPEFKEPLISTKQRRRTVCKPRRSMMPPPPKSPIFIPTAKSIERFQKQHNKDVLDLLNKGSAKDLQVLALVGQKKANLIVLWRNLRGPFKTFQDLKKVASLGTNFHERFMNANVLTSR